MNDLERLVSCEDGDKPEKKTNKLKKWIYKNAPFKYVEILIAATDNYKKKAKPETFDKVKFGARIKEARTKAKITQTDLGKMIKVKRSSIANIESGKQNTTLDKIAEICRLLNVEPNYLFGYDN